MRTIELLRLVWLNLSQNKFKVILTSIGIVVGSATIMMVIAIGTGGKMEVAEQFKNLNAGAIDISYETADSGFSGGTSSFSFGGGGGMPSGKNRSSGGGNSGGGNSGGGMPSMPSGDFGNFGSRGEDESDRLNKEKITEYYLLQ